MTYAQTAVMATNAYCRELYNDVDMGSTHFNGIWADAFDHRGYASHKYIDKNKYNEQLGMKRGAGVYGYWAMEDGSNVLCTCKGELAYTDAEDNAHWWRP